MSNTVIGSPYRQRPSQRSMTSFAGFTIPRVSRVKKSRPEWFISTRALSLVDVLDLMKGMTKKKDTLSDRPRLVMDRFERKRVTRYEIVNQRALGGNGAEQIDVT